MRRHEQALGVFASDGRRRSQDFADMVIVGNGIAGLTAAVEARRLAPEKRIVIVTEQSHPTINTPALKQFAFGRLAQEQLLAHPAGTERAQQIEVINARVEEIKSRGKFVCLSDGSSFGYDSLLLATGSKPNGLPAWVPGRTFDGVLSLHRLSDYLDLRRRLRLREVNDAVVIGGGTHAMETVMGLLHGGIRVHWLIRSATFLPKMLDRTASGIALEQSRRAGARVSTETEVVGILGRVGTVAGVVTNHQETLPCQLVLICTGSAPVTALAESCDVPLKYKQGIFVDDALRTNVRDIYAAGDAAALWNPRTAEYQPRAHWHTAVVQGRVAAAVMTGYREQASSFGVPWHATRLGGLSLLSVGDPLHGPDDEVTLTDRRRGGYRLLSMRDERLVGYLSLGTTQPDGLAIKRIIDEEISIREVASALLTGEFDAGQYFAQRHAHAAHRMAATGKFTVPDTPRPLFQASTGTKMTHNTEPLLLTSILNGQQDLRDDEDPLQQRVEQQVPLLRSFQPLASRDVETQGWVVPELLPEGLVVLAGKQQIGKSWLGLAMGLGVASGETILGGIEVEQGHVLYLALEESEQRLQERLSQLLVQGASLHQDFEYATSWPGMDDGGLTDIEAWLIAHPQARLVIIDAWTRVQPTMEEQADGAEYESFERLRELAHAYHISILVHFHIDQATSDHLFDELTALSSANACADAILHLKRTRGNTDAALSGAGRAYTQGLDLALSFQNGCWKVAGQAAAVHTHGTLSKARSAILDVLHECERPMKPKEIALVLGKRDGTIRKMLCEMKASHLIEETEQGYRALVPKATILI